MYIDKKPYNKSLYKRKFIYFDRARDAFKFALEHWNICKEGILLPSYIGWSPNEGSGVMDPVKEMGCRYNFYKLNYQLMIDIKDLEYKIRTFCPKAVLVIHYFGFVDPNIKLVADLCKQYGLLLFEDQAHSMLSDLIGGISGCYGVASFYSIHKILADTIGGVLVTLDDKLINPDLYPEYLDFFRYNLCQIAKSRVENWKLTAAILKRRNKPQIMPLYRVLYRGVIPHSFPVLIEKYNRDELYFKLNENGYGVTSLYHTLIEDIKEREYPASYFISKRILNLPIHQEAGGKDIIKLISELINLLE